MVTNDQWEILAPLFVKDRRRKKFMGRPKVHSDREILNAVLWILRTGAQWAELPDKYPPYQTVHRRFQAWAADGTFHRVLAVLANDLRKRSRRERFASIDGSFVRAKKGDLALAIPKSVKGQRSWQLQTVLLYLWPLPASLQAAMKSVSSCHS